MAKRKAVKRRVTRKKATPRKKVKRRKISARTPTPRKKRPAPKRTARKRRKPRAPQPKVLKAVERVSVERTLAGKRRKRTRSKPRTRPRTYSRRRSVSGKGGNKLLLGLAIGAGAYLLLSGGLGGSSNTTPPPTGLGQLVQTSNPTRNSKSQEILNYAMAAGLAVNAIMALIDRLNSSSDNEVDQIYNHVESTGDVGAWV